MQLQFDIMRDEFDSYRDLYEKLNANKDHHTNSNDICTPIECVKEMVDSIPSSFWARKDIDILDPCCGNGNFHAYIQLKIDSTAKLHFNEINPKRVEILKGILGADINITTKDFLDFGTEKKYDLIVANPPYAKMQSNGQRASKNHTMSRQFLYKALELINDNGFILFIIPNNWMSLSDRNHLPKIMSAYHFHHINIHGAKKYFKGIGSSFTWFLWQKTKSKKPTLIENFYGLKDTQKVFINEKTDFIPLYYSALVRSIIEKVVNDEGETYEVLTTSDLHKTTKKHLIRDYENAQFCYRLIHTPKQIVYSSRPHKWQEGWKVFISLTDKYGTFIDNCGMTQSIAFIRCNTKAEAQRVCKELQNPVYRFVNHITRYGNFNNVRVLQKLRKLESIQLTVEEMDFIRHYLEVTRR